MEDKKMLVIEAMEKYGGSFVKELAKCFRQADHNNFKKLKETFSDYWAQYENMLEEKDEFEDINAGKGDEAVG